MITKVTRTAALAATLCWAAPVVAQEAKGQWQATKNGACQVWNSDPQPNESLSWSGACVNGKAEGKGILVSSFPKEGKPFVTRSEGLMRAGKLHGRIVAASSEGSRLECDFADGAPNGHGVFTFEGARYEGMFKDGIFHGRGVFTFANGDRYEGEFANGTFHGRGVHISANGSRREGNWVNGTLAGP